MTNAAKKYNLSTGNLCSCCKGKVKYVGKLNDGTLLKWEYYYND
jgi:hypothetical protein